MRTNYPCSSYTPTYRLIDVNDPVGNETWPLQAIVTNFFAPNFMIFEWLNPDTGNQWRLVNVTNITYDDNNNPISAIATWWPYPFNV